MEAQDKHWLSPAFLAPNVMEVSCDMDAFAPVLELLPQIQLVEADDAPITLGSGQRFNTMAMSPQWASDILWISQDDLATYHFFDAMFRASGICERVAHRIEHDRDVRLYSGFFVTRSQCERADFHVDWLEANNQAFTFLLPLTDNCTQMGLTYRNARGEVASYAYQLGKGLIFGDYFEHATAPGQTEERSVLLCFTFGTDRMEDWPRIAETAAAQGRVHCRPDGVLMRGKDKLGSR